MIKQSHWFFGFRVRTKALAMVECQGLDGVLEVVCINGGLISQTEQLEVPKIIKEVRSDAPHGGVRCAINIRNLSFVS